MTKIKILLEKCLQQGNKQHLAESKMVNMHLWNQWLKLLVGSKVAQRFVDDDH